MYLLWTSFHPGFPRCGGDVEKHVKKESSVPSIFANLQTSFNSLIKAMKKIVFSLVLSIMATFVSAQIYVWKDGNVLLENPDSVTFVEPDLGLQVTDEISNGLMSFKYQTKDNNGMPIWMSATLQLTPAQLSSKRVGKMAMYNHYSIMSADEAPTAGKSDLQLAPYAMGMAVVSADCQGFGETDNMMQAYCFGEANARASIDALLAAREWLLSEGYTLGDTILNYGYSQGGQTTVAAVKLSQSDEYRGRVHFTKSIAAAGPHDLQLTYRNFIENETLGMPQALALTIIANNELLGLGFKYSDIFQKPLASHWKGWFLSKKFSSDEISDLIGTNEIASIMKPAYLDVNSEETQTLLNAVKIHDLTSGWTPDTDTDILIMHSQNDDVVPYANSEKLYQFFVNAGVRNVQFDNTYLKNDHETSGTDFFLYLVTKFLPKW